MKEIIDIIRLNVRGIKNQTNICDTIFELSRQKAKRAYCANCKRVGKRVCLGFNCEDVHGYLEDYDRL